MTAIETVLAWAGLVFVCSIPVSVAGWLYWRTWLTVRDSFADARWLLRWHRNKYMFDRWLDETGKDPNPEKKPSPKPSFRTWLTRR